MSLFQNLCFLAVGLVLGLGDRPFRTSPTQSPFLQSRLPEASPIQFHPATPTLTASPLGADFPQATPSLFSPQHSRESAGRKRAGEVARRDGFAVERRREVDRHGRHQELKHGHRSVGQAQAKRSLPVRLFSLLKDLHGLLFARLHEELLKTNVSCCLTENLNSRKGSETCLTGWAHNPPLHGHSLSGSCVFRDHQMDSNPRGNRTTRGTQTPEEITSLEGLKPPR